MELLFGDPDRYDAAGDFGAIRRVGAVTWLLTSVLAVVMLPFWPPTRTIGVAGWAPALCGAAGVGALGVATLMRQEIGLRMSLLVSMLDVVILGALAWLAGPSSEYMILIALPVVFIGASQAPRRAAAAVGVVALVEAVVIFSGPFSAGIIAAGALRLIVWMVMTGLALVWTGGVRWQRLALRDQQARASHQALHDPVTGLGNRRKLLADLEAAVAGGEPALVALFDLNGFKAYNDSFGHPAGDALLARLSAKLVAAAGAAVGAYRMGGDEFCLLARGSGCHTLDLLALGRAALSEHGQGFLVTAAGGSASLPEEVTDPVEALRLADGRMYADKHERRGRAATDGAEMLLAILQERDPALSAHSSAVASLAARVAERLGLSDLERAHLVRAAELHDIGKLAIPDAIGSKPAPLDTSEWEFMRRHTLIGERVTGLSADLEPVARIIRATHERWDGSGYPDGLHGEQIPLASRIIGVCDAYDAMGSERAYRPALAPEAILSELGDGTGSQFDPRVVDALLEILYEDAAARSASAGAAEPQVVDLQ